MNKSVLVILMLLVFIPLFANAAWWNPISWLSFIEDLFTPRAKIIYVPSPSASTASETTAAVATTTNPSNANLSKVSITPKPHITATAIPIISSQPVTEAPTTNTSSAQANTPVPITIVLTTPPPRAPIYDEHSFVTDLGNVYTPFDSNFFFYYKRMAATIGSSNGRSNPQAAGDFYSAEQVLLSARGNFNTLESKYPSLSGDDLTALTNLKNGLDNLYLAVNYYALVAKEENLATITQLTANQTNQITYENAEANADLQAVHDFLTIKL